MSSAAGAFLELTLILIPLSVVVAWIMGIEMDLDFSLLKTGCLAFTIIVIAFTLQVLFAFWALSFRKRFAGKFSWLVLNKVAYRNNDN
ncbi:hypothetical protein RIF29_30803 [Crotalaria pallida]|uniref:Uncharacterized protein n=1 Tax=Crotalaria pallida TaxID=3830 RepID=A0AAN9ELR7_CROPI